MNPNTRPHRYRFRHALIALVIGLGSPFLLREAHAEDPSKTTFIEGVVLSIEGSDLVIDLGTTRGVSQGDLIEVWRPLKLRHPVTGKIVEDRSRSGRRRPGRPSLSLAVAEGRSPRNAEKGDLVITSVSSSSVTSSAPKQHRPAVTSSDRSRCCAEHTSIDEAGPAIERAEPSKEKLDPDAAERSTSLINLRIERYEAIARAKPRSRYAAVLYEEAKALRALYNNKESSAQSEASPFGEVDLNFPTEVSPTLPVELTLTVQGAQGMVLQVRSDGATGFTSVPMDLVGHNIWRGLVPQAFVKSPGFDYFIEATDTHGKTQRLVASIQAPARLKVREEGKPNQVPPVRVTASVLTDLAFYNTKKANDYAWQTEGYFGARFSDVGFRAIRSGFGVYRGKGGTLEDLDVNKIAPRDVGLTYGYLEGEYAFVDTFSLALRAVVGLRDSGVSGGAQGFFRIGSDRATNLIIGGEFLGGVGVRGITQLEWNTIPKVPIMLRTEVTNQPAGVASNQTFVPVTDGATTEGVSKGQGEVGARVIAQVGYRFTPALTVSLRGSYQGRTINHAGPGGGAGVTYEW
ncbi:MAG: hypothetical protein U0165_06125 [Polyangiaceae bacterium]